MPVSERSYADLMRANASLGRRLRDAEGQATLFRGAVKRREAEVERLREAARRARLFLADFHSDNQREVIDQLDDALDAS